MADKLTFVKLGIIGMSEGNGHPYSWSAIFNGFDPFFMKDCPYPAIPKYLQEKQFPNDFLNDMGIVNSIWTQKKTTTEHIAKSSFIETICENLDDLVKESDAILLARDDAEKHLEMASLFLKKGIPIFIDKPFATCLDDAKKMLELQKFEHQIFTCSSLRYAKEITLTNCEFNQIGKLIKIVAKCPKYWSTYAVHLIEPIIANSPKRGKLLKVQKVINKNHIVHIRWEQLFLEITMTGKEKSAIEFHFIGDKATVTKEFTDSFSCFKDSLITFLEQIHKKQILIPRNETMEIVEILERGK